MRKLAFMAIALVAPGCGPRITTTPAPTEVSGRVTLAGTPVTDVKVNFQPIGPGLPATIPVTDGEFRGHVTPGQYTYYLSEGSSEATLESIPEKYRAGAMDRKLDVAPGATLTLSLE